MRLHILIDAVLDSEVYGEDRVQHRLGGMIEGWDTV